MNLFIVYLAPLMVIWAGFYGTSKLRERRALLVKRAAVEAGLIEPASLHPKVNPEICVGCATCVAACPEGRIIGLVHGKAELVEPTHCIGHGACAAACPMTGIELVFGTERRGVDIPHVAPDFQTNVPGIYIAGELGGMGLIRNAIEQGRQAMEEIVKQRSVRVGAPLDVLIVGAGPAGLAASLGAMEAGMTFETIEQDTMGGTVAHFPRGKLVMTAPAELPMYGQMMFHETSKETLMAFWSDLVEKTGLKIRHSERVESIVKEDAYFRVTTTKGTYLTGAVLLAIGRRGTPRTLSVPGEDHEKVVYRLTNPEQYRGQKVLVVGGGDSALEAATSIAEESGTEVTLSYRSDGFSRAKLKNRKKVEMMQTEGRLRVLLSSNVREIAPEYVRIDQNGQQTSYDNEAVIVCAGGILPTGFLKSIGVEVETKYGTA